MSSHQLHDFRVIDRSLTPLEQKKVASLSSHFEAHPTHYQAIYHYSNFRHDPLEVVARYFDAYYSIASWGHRRLIFKLPRALVDLLTLTPYLVEQHITLVEREDQLLLDLDLGDEDLADWVAEDESIEPFLPLRAELLRGDLRLLYLAWLRAAQGELLYENEAEDILEPPVPPGLEQLAPHHEAFIAAFGVDAPLIKAAAINSAKLVAVTRAQLGAAIARLSVADCRGFLLDLVQGEGSAEQVAMRVMRRLALPQRPQATRGQRSIAELETAAEAITAARKRAKKEAQKRQKAQQAERERKRIQELMARKDELWREVRSLVEEKKAEPYEKAVKILLDLRMVATLERALKAYYRNVDALVAEYPGCQAFLRRLRDRALIGRKRPEL